MTGSALSFPPYLASTLWWQGESHSRALKTRDYTRTLIASNSPKGMVLTVPVVGGAAAAKRLAPGQLKISDHGDWTRIHLGAIEAAYAREPYFRHLFPELEDIITNHTELLSALCVSLSDRMLGFLDYSSAFPEVQQMRIEHPERYWDIAKRLAAKVTPEHSFLEPLFRLGPDTLFLL